MNTSEVTGTPDRSSTDLSIELPSNVSDGITAARGDRKDTQETAPKAERKFKAALRDKLGDKDSAPAKDAVSVAAEPVAPSPKIPPPADMSPEEREHWDKAPPEIQAYWSRRALEQRRAFTERTTQLSQREKEVSDVFEAVTPMREQLARENVSVADTVKNSLAWAKAMRGENKVDAAREWLSTWGIKPEQLIQGTPNGQQAAQPSGEWLTAEQAEELATRKAEEIVQRHFSERDQQRIVDTSRANVDSFIQSKPLLANPSLGPVVEGLMANRIVELRSANPSISETVALSQAYDDVVAQFPALQTLAAPPVATPKPDPAQEAQRAKAAAKSISGGPGSGSPKQTYANFRDNLRGNLSK